MDNTRGITFQEWFGGVLGVTGELLQRQRDRLQRRPDTFSDNLIQTIIPIAVIIVIAVILIRR